MSAASQPLGLVKPTWKVPDLHSGIIISKESATSSGSSLWKSSIALRLSHTLLCRVYEKRVQRLPCHGRKSGKVYSTAAKYFSFGETGIVQPFWMYCMKGGSPSSGSKAGISVSSVNSG